MSGLEKSYTAVYKRFTTTKGLQDEKTADWGVIRVKYGHVMLIQELEPWNSKLIIKAFYLKWNSFTKILMIFFSGCSYISYMYRGTNKNYWNISTDVHRTVQ
jgi:hypothetical protein